MTGKQGGAVARALKGTGFHLRGLTRRPDSELSAALVRDCIGVVKGDLDDESSLRRAIAGVWGVWGVFDVQTPGKRAPSGKRRRASVLRHWGSWAVAQ